MSFFNLSDNSNALPTNGQFETGGGDIEPIPANTNVLAAPDEAKWDEHEGDQYISLRWVVLSPAEYKNRKIFQKIRVQDVDDKKRDKAIRMLAAIDANAGGKLMATGERPTDQSLTVSLVNKPMVLKVQVWEMERDGQARRGNWISAVSPRQGGGQQQQAPTPAAEPAPTPTAGGGFEDDIPFAQHMRQMAV